MAGKKNRQTDRQIDDLMERRTNGQTYKQKVRNK